MVEMEKITFTPLIELLEARAEALERAIEAAKVKNLRLTEVPSWFKNVIEPVFSALFQHDPEIAARLFEPLFRNMLKVLCGNYNVPMMGACDLLIAANPAVTGSVAVLDAFNTALRKIGRISQAAAEKWLKLMQRIVPLAGSRDELLDAGKVAAWRCGMAHLRGLIADPQTLNPEILLLIFSGDKGCLAELKRRWNSDSAQTPIAVGAFTGFAGAFRRPPRIAFVENLVLAQDGKRWFAVFADRFGGVLLDHPGPAGEPVFSSSATRKSGGVAAILKPYADLTSWVYHDETLFFTLASSHSIMVFGGVNH